MQHDLLDDLPVKKGGKVLSDQWIVLTNGVQARRIVALVEVDGKEREMTFLTNNLEWSAETIVALYEARWQIELLFKQMKQTLKLCDLMSCSANGIRWQVWIALLVQLIMRYFAWVSGWQHSFVRLYALVRAILWRQLDIIKVLQRYGTAKGVFFQESRQRVILKVIGAAGSENLGKFRCSRRAWCAYGMPVCLLVLFGRRQFADKPQ